MYTCQNWVKILAHRNLYETYNKGLKFAHNEISACKFKDL